MRPSKRCILCNFEEARVLYPPLNIVKCRGCGLIYRDVLKIEDDYYSNLDKYRQSLDDQVKMQARQRDATLRFDIIDKVIKERGLLLDIGANDGLSMLEAERRGFSSIGCEPNIYAFSYAKEQGLKIINKSFEDAFFELKEKGPFKVITLFHVLEHLPQPLEALRMARELMDEEGYLVVEVPDISSPWSKIYSWDDLKVNREHLFYFKEKTLRALLEKAGFRIVFKKRKVWDGFQRSFLENLIRLPLVSEVYALERRIKNYFKSFFKVSSQQPDIEDNRELWVRGKMEERKPFLSEFWGKIIFYLNRGDDLLVIGRKR